MYQQTIQQEIALEGVGVHSGSKSTITIKPALADHGIVIHNPQFPDSDIIIGTIVPISAMHATVLRTQTWGISTVEHVLAALSALGIDNVILSVDAQEIPILDGSALPFVQALHTTGIVLQDVPKHYLTPKEKLTFKDDDGRLIEIIPARTGDCSLTFDYQSDFAHPLLKSAKISGMLTPVFFEKEIAPARTFGFLEQLDMLRKHSLAQGTTLGNTVVIGQDSYLNERRFDDEFVRHKLLDLIGDLALLGKPLAGTVIARKTGHAFNRLVVEHYLNNPDQWKTYE